MDRPEVIAVIPARGGSKGIRGKNVRTVGGIPLVVRSVRAAVGAESVDRVVVSSDDEAILDLAIEAGAEAHHRSPQTASDEASSEAALLEAIQDLGVVDPQTVLAFVQCTSPFLTSHDIDAVIDPVLRSACDTSFSAAPFHGFLWATEADGSGMPLGHDAGARRRRQDEPVRLIETGGVYAMRVGAFVAAGSRFHGTTKPVPVDARLAMEIDDPGDLAFARAVAPVVDASMMRGRSIELPAVEELDLVVLDFDGVFTDDRVLVTSDGSEAVLCDRSDGRAVVALRDDVPVVVISSETDPVVRARCEKLGLEYSQGHGNMKEEALASLLRARGIDPQRVLYVGNDTNDVGCLRSVGYPVVVADATPVAIAAAKHVLRSRGGRGALRELAEGLLGRAL